MLHRLESWIMTCDSLGSRDENGDTGVTTRSVLEEVPYVIMHYVRGLFKMSRSFSFDSVSSVSDVFPVPRETIPRSQA